MIVYLVSPANMATGGTELLHQFSQCLTEMNIENYMVYPDRDEIKCPTPDTFLKYGVKYVTHYVDTPDSVLVLTETQLHLINECVQGTAVAWWLSVDNYLDVYRDHFDSEELDIFGLKGRKNAIHFVQSNYAKDFVENTMDLGECFFLKDYINDQIIDVANANGNALDRQDICLYNPKKGKEDIMPVIEATKDSIQWIPLIGMKPDEMAQAMCSAKAYIDFGKHPGKDRIPREAAVCGCLIMTNKKGSAAYQGDVNIPMDCKFDDTSNVQAVAEKIKDMLANYDERIQEYEPYRQQIRGEKEEFLQEVHQAVVLLKEIVESKPKSETNLMAYAQPLVSVRKIVQAMDKMAADSINACYEGDSEHLTNQLLDMDYMLQLVRETIYAELQDL